MDHTNTSPLLLSTERTSHSTSSAIITTTSSDPPTNTEESHLPTLTTAQVVGIIVGIALAFPLFVSIACFVKRRADGKQRKEWRERTGNKLRQEALEYEMYP